MYSCECGKKYKLKYHYDNHIKNNKCNRNPSISSVEEVEDITEEIIDEPIIINLIEKLAPKKINMKVEEEEAE